MSSYRIAVTGDPACGKTAFIHRLKEGKFKKHTEALEASNEEDSDNGMWSRKSTPDERLDFSLIVDEKERKLSVLDGGRARSGGRSDETYYKVPLQFTKANAILVAFDTSSKYGLRSSFRLLQMAQRDAAIYGTPVFLVGLKSDKRDSSISFEDAQREANEHLCDSYFECSAKTGEGVNDVIAAVFHELDSIEERDGGTPTIPDMKERRVAYNAQRGAKVKAVFPEAVKPLPSTPTLTSDTPDGTLGDDKTEAKMEVKTRTYHAKVKGGARPAKQAAPCVLQ